MSSINYYFLDVAAMVVVATQLPFFLLTVFGVTDKVEDFSYGLTFVIVSFVLMYVRNEYFLHHILVAVFITLWGLRLACFLFWRVHRMKSDWRLERFRKSTHGIIMFWTFQAIAIFINALPLCVCFSGGSAPWTRQDFFGCCFFAVGLTMETVADIQKTLFKEKQPNHWCNVGLWRWCRYPNYFGEILCWFGIACVSSSSASDTWGNLLAATGPLWITLLLTQVSGIPILERRADRTYAGLPEYKLYKETTSLLIPMPPGSLTKME